jgi:hypothetical protein
MKNCKRFGAAVIISIIFTINCLSQTLEHQYSAKNGSFYKVADNEYIYTTYDLWQDFKIYSTAHTLLKTISFSPVTNYGYSCFNISRTLFNNDPKFEVAYFYQIGSNYNVRIINEDGVVLFDVPNIESVTFKHTNLGTKLLLVSKLDNFVEVYALPGILYDKPSGNIENEVEVTYSPYQSISK